MAFTDFAGGDPYQRYEGDSDEDGGGPALELLDFSIEQSEADEDEEEMRAEHLQRGFAEGEERLARDDLDHVSAQEIEDDGEADEVDDTKRTDLPLIKLKAERLRGEVGAEPTESDSDEDETDEEAHDGNPAGSSSERKSVVGEFGSEPQADGPDGLPRKEIEGSCFLQGDVEMSDVLDESVGHVAQAKLSAEPDESTGGEDFLPSEADCRGQNDRSEDEEDDVHGQNVKQRRAIKQENGADDGGRRMREIEIEKIGERGAVGVDGVSGSDGEGEEEQDQVVAVDL